MLLIANNLLTSMGKSLLDTAAYISITEGNVTMIVEFFN